jgi:DNA gyrase/topoisomerase IV subunit A
MLARTGEGDTGGIDAFRPEHLPKHYGMQADGLYKLSDDQAQEILQMRLQRLTGLEQDKIVNEYKDVMAEIADLLDILAKPARVTTIITDEMTSVVTEFGDPTRIRAVPDRAQRQRPEYRRPDHAAGHGGDPVAHRLHEGAADLRIPRAEARRPRQAGHGDQG